MENNSALKFNASQIESIIDKVVPLIASPEDHEFFKGLLYLVSEQYSSAQFSVFIEKCLIERNFRQERNHE
jgi:hypothetical protein